MYDILSFTCVYMYIVVPYTGSNQNQDGDPWSYQISSPPTQRLPKARRIFLCLRTRCKSNGRLLQATQALWPS